MPARLFFQLNISKQSPSPHSVQPKMLSISCSEEKDEDAAVLRPSCLDFFRKTVNACFVFCFAGTYFLCFDFQMEGCFDFYLLYIFSETFIRTIVRLIKDFSGSLVFFFPLLWILGSLSCHMTVLPLTAKRGCAAAGVARLGTCASEDACTRASSTPSPSALVLPPVSFIKCGSIWPPSSLWPHVAR